MEDQVALILQEERYVRRFYESVVLMRCSRPLICNIAFVQGGDGP